MNIKIIIPYIIAMMLFSACGKASTSPPTGSDDASVIEPPIVSQDITPDGSKDKDYLDEKGYPKQGVEGAYDKWHEDIQKAVLETESKVTYLYATILNVDASGAVAFWSDNSSYYRSEWNEFYAPEAKITNTYGKELTVDDLKAGQKIIATIKSDSAAPIESNPMCYAVFTIKVLPDEITPDSKLPIGENFRQEPIVDEDVEVEADNGDYEIQ